MAKLIFTNTQNVIDLPDDSDISEACEREGIPFACSEGICGSCVVEVVEGMENLSEYTQAEEDFLGPLGVERLACQCRIKSGEVKLKY